MAVTLYFDLVLGFFRCWSPGWTVSITANRGALYNHVSAVVVTIVIGLLHLTCRSPF